MCRKARPSAARGRTDLPKIVDQYMDGKIVRIDERITHRLPLARIEVGFDLMKAGESIGLVVIS